MGLRAFLEIISQEPPALMRACAWEKHIDGELLRVLKEQGILLSGPRAQWYENCPGASLACPARIIPTVGLRPKPYQAVPPEGHRCCRPKYLSEEEVATLEFNLPAFIAFVREELGIAGTPRLDSSLLSDGVILSIGHKAGIGQARSVYYVPSLSNWAVVERLRTMRIVGPPALVLVPARSGQVMPELEIEFSGHDRMQMQFLEDLLAWDGARVERVAPPQATPSTSIVAVAFTDRGTFELDEAGYQALVQTREDYGFFLDTVQMKDQQYLAIGLGDERHVGLTPRAAAVLVEIVEAKDGKEERSFVALSDIRRAKPAKFVEAARRLVDTTRDSRTDWTMFKTRAQFGGPKRYYFAPPSDLRYAVLRPVRR